MCLDDEPGSLSCYDFKHESVAGYQDEVVPTAQIYDQHCANMGFVLWSVTSIYIGCQFMRGAGALG